MTSVQERLQIKREPLDKWSVREQLCLAFAVAKSGDQNWMSVSRMLKPFGEPNRPVDWFHQKNCASQYGSLLENVDTPKRKKRTSGAEGAIETPIEVILRKLTRERISELNKALLEEKNEYLKAQEEMTLLQSGNITEDLIDKWCKELDEEEHKKDEESIKHAQWLKEREMRKQEIERAWRPFTKFPYISTPKRKPSDSSDSLMDVDTIEESSSTPISSENNARPALSPLLTSLLKSPSPVQGGVTSSILHSVITNQRSSANNSTITNLLNTSPDLNSSQNLHMMTTTITQPQDVSTASDGVSSDSISSDLLQDAVDSLPNIKVEDLESSILSSDDPLPEIKNEEVEVIISDLIQNADIVSDPEQHLNLDDNVDIITNLDNELQVLCDEEKAAEEAAAKAAAEAAAKAAAEAAAAAAAKEAAAALTAAAERAAKEAALKEAAAKEAALKDKVEAEEKIAIKPPSPKIDPFEFEEDPDISQIERPSHTKQHQTAEDNKFQQAQSLIKQIDVCPELEKSTSTVEEKQEKQDAQLPGSVEIVEVVVMEETQIDKELNKTQIQDIVHSVKLDEPELPSENVEASKTTEIETVLTPSQAVENSETTKSSEQVEEAQEATNEIKEEKLNIAELPKVKEDTKSPTSGAFTSEFSESFFDDITMEVNKLDKSGKAKRDYSRTKKRESDKEFDILLAVEKAVSAELSTELPDDTSDESDKKYDTFKPKIKGESNDRSSSPWTEEEEPTSTARNKRRYSTPATPNDSIPNSPASSSTYFEDEREYKNWKKAIMLFYNRLITHKYSSMFLKPITDDVAPGYHSLIHKPMDLTTIRKNIESGAIRTTQELQRDVMLMFTNAVMFNKTNQFIYNIAMQMQQETMQQLKIFMQAQQGDAPQRRETRTSEPTKRKRISEDNNPRTKKRKEDL